MEKLLAGAVGGLIATAPMTLAMNAMRLRLPVHERYALPPRQVAMRAAEKVHLRRHLDEPEKRGLTLLAHFGYGAAAGALYGPLAPRSLGASVAGGVGFGLLVWAASYLGLLPALGLHPSAARQPARRNALMVAAHVVWGGTLGALSHQLRHRMKSL